MKWSKNQVSVSERRILDLASLSISKAKSVSLTVFHKHPFSSFFLLYFFPLFRPTLSQGSVVLGTPWLWIWVQKPMSPHWIQESPNFEAWMYPDLIKARLLLMQDNNAFSHPSDWIFVLSWQMDNAVMNSWTTFPKQKASKKTGSASTADSQRAGTNSNMKVLRGSILLRTLWTVLSVGYVLAKIVTAK